MKYEPVIENDKGPIVNWIANRMVAFAGLLLDKFSEYSTMYELNYDEWDYSGWNYEELIIPHNQMTFEEVEDG